MNLTIRAALKRLLAGDHSLLEGLGIQRESTSGTWVNAQTSTWHEVLDVAGDGAISLRLNRAVGDAGGQAIGEYRTNLGQEDLLELVQLVHDTAWEDFKLTRPLKPTNVKIIFRLVIDGHRWEKVVGVAPPPAMDSIQAALQKFDAVAIALRKSPASTLGLTLALPKTIQEDTQRLEVGLEFENTGLAGFWFTNPARIGGAEDDRERCVLLQGFYEEPQPGVTPLPMIPSACPLTPTRPAAAPGEEPPPLPELVWIAPGAKYVARYQTAPNFEQTGRHVARAEFSTYAGSDVVCGQPRLRGCVFSAEGEFQVERRGPQ